MKSEKKKRNENQLTEEEKLKKAAKRNTIRKIVPFSLSLIAMFLLVYISILTAESGYFSDDYEAPGTLQYADGSVLPGSSQYADGSVLPGSSQHTDNSAESILNVSDVSAPAGKPSDNSGNSETVTVDPKKSGLPKKGNENTFNYSDLPRYGKDAYVAVNDNFPYFTRDDFTNVSSETYGELDSLGRCTACFSVIGPDLMPTEDRGSIGSVKPTGWQNEKYDIVDGGYLYNRCHLIGYQLTAENANKQNLITGTRYLNIDGMLEFENMTADYIKETGNHVLYRVTPIFRNRELVARGVLMEGYSVEDNGEGICFCVYAYNVQPGIKIDYKTGESTQK